MIGEYTQLVAMVVGQALAFLLFFWIMSRFAWGPVMDFLETRRERIRHEFGEIEKLKRKLVDERKEIEQRLEGIEEEARRRIQEAVSEGRRMSEEIAERARSEARHIRERAREMTEIELAKAMQEVKDEVIAMTLAAAERLLEEKMDDARHRALVDRFIEELEEIER